MRVQFLASGSRGNAAILRAGGTTALLDAGVPIRRLGQLLADAGIGHRSIDHIVVSHGHLDHARSAGIIAKRHGSTLHCAEKIRFHKAVSRAQDWRELPIDGESELTGTTDADRVTLRTVRVPHDCDPTVALRFEHGGRALGIVTDMGEPREAAAELVRGVHVLGLESNHDTTMLANGPYSAPLKERIAGAGGHLSNDEMAVMLRSAVTPELHTVVLLHLSEENNSEELARSAAEGALESAGRTDVRVLVARQHDSLEPIDV